MRVTGVDRKHLVSKFKRCCSDPKFSVVESRGPPVVGLAVSYLVRLALGKPETVLAWHRAGFRLFWTWKVRHGQPGRPGISREDRDLIRKMCRENPGWGAPRIHGELLKLGIDVCESSVSKYMVRSRQATVSDLAHVPGESRPAVGLRRFLHRAHYPFPGPLRVSGIGP